MSNIQSRNPCYSGHRVITYAIRIVISTFLALVFFSASVTEAQEEDLVGIWDTTLFGFRLAAKELIALAQDYRTETWFTLAGFLLADLGHLFLDRFF